MYKLLRDLHLFFGLLAASFFVVYSLGAVMMGHSGLFPRPSQTKTQLELRHAPDTDAEIISALRTQGALRGDTFYVKSSSTTLSFTVKWPSGDSKVDFDRLTRIATVVKGSTEPFRLMARLHKTAGWWHDEPILNVWGVVVVIASLVLLALSFSGLLMWFKRNRERAVGGVLLLGSLLIAGGLLVFIRL